MLGRLRRRLASASCVTRTGSPPVWNSCSPRPTSRARYSLNQAQASYQQARWEWYRVSGHEFPVEVPLAPEVRERLRQSEARVVGGTRGVR